MPYRVTYTIRYPICVRFQENRLTPYRRHATDCASGKKPELRSELKKCQCPLWVHGRVHGELYRKSLGTRSLQKAMQKITEKLNVSSRQGWKSSGVKVPVPSIACIQTVSISGACGGNKARYARM